MTEPRHAAASAIERSSLLIELGCEELPPKALDDLRDAFFAAVGAGLEREGLAFDTTSSRAFSTPRRLALLLSQVAAAQPDQNLERRGPALKAAFHADGTPSAAALGFARSVNLDVEQLERLETDKGAWLMARTHNPGKSLDSLIFPVLEQALRQLPIPRPMRWADHEFSFVRPVHWLVVMHGARVLEGCLLGQSATGQTQGHRIHSPGPHTLGRADDYLDVLRHAYVLADPNARKRRIREQTLALEPDARIDNALLDEVNNLLEWPVPVACSFDESFLSIPHEVLVASMQEHQKFFPVNQHGPSAIPQDGGPLPVRNRFIAVANLESAQVERVREGFERVIRPRLADARFFLEQDQKHPLEAFSARLKAVVFQNKAGTLGDKSTRIAALSKKIASQLGVEPVACERAGMLAKCDLMSLMVGEFPELQGIMGRYYALHSGESTTVAHAIGQHYQPRFAGDAIPASAAGQVLSLADRADTLVSLFSVGQRPSGNKDPFALRRCALGLVRILLEACLPLNLSRLLAFAANELSAQGIVSAPPVLAELHDFITERARHLLRDDGHTAERVNAAMASSWDTFADLNARLKALTGFIGQESGLSLAAANKRIGNILRKADFTPKNIINEELFVFDEESILFKDVIATEQILSPLLKAKEYDRCLDHLARLRPAVDAFFDQVMVMDENPALRENRLALLARLKSQFDQIADLSVLGA